MDRLGPTGSPKDTWPMDIWHRNLQLPYGIHLVKVNDENELWHDDNYINVVCCLTPRYMPLFDMTAAYNRV